MSFSRKKYKQEAKALGHSPDFIKETLEYAQILQDQELPVIFSTRHLSFIFALDWEYLRKLVNSDRSYSYKFYEIQKRKGGYRQISVPFRNLKQIQQWINTHILSKAAVAKEATGFIKQRSIKDNALPHVGKKVILNIDLLKFFDTITEKRVYYVFKNLGYHPNLAVDLAKLTTVTMQEEYFDTFSPFNKKLFQHIIDKNIAVLPQGAPTSPALSNLVAKELDRKMVELALRHNCVYTRYADDMTLSTDNEAALHA